MPKITITPLTSITTPSGEIRQLVQVDLTGNQFEGDDYRKAGYQCASAIRKASTDGKAYRVSSGGSWGYSGRTGTFTASVVYSISGLKAAPAPEVPATIREACERIYSDRRATAYVVLTDLNESNEFGHTDIRRMSAALDCEGSVSRHNTLTGRTVVLFENALTGQGALLHGVRYFDFCQR